MAISGRARHEHANGGLNA